MELREWLEKAKSRLAWCEDQIGPKPTDYVKWAQECGPALIAKCEELAGVLEVAERGDPSWEHMRESALRAPERGGDDERRDTSRIGRTSIGWRRRGGVRMAVKLTERDVEELEDLGHYAESIEATARLVGEFASDTRVPWRIEDAFERIAKEALMISRYIESALRSPESGA